MAKLDIVQRDRLFTIMLANSFDAVVVTDGDPEDHRIVFVNDRFCEMTGYCKEELVGKSPRMLNGSKIEHRTSVRLKKALKEKTAFMGTTTNYKKDGTPYTVQWNMHPVLGEDGEADYFISIQRDYTALRNFLNKLKETNHYIQHFLQELKLTDSNDSSLITGSKQGNKTVFSEGSNTAADLKEVFEDDPLFDFEAENTQVAASLEGRSLNASTFHESTNTDPGTIVEITTASTLLNRYVTQYHFQDLDRTDRAGFIQELQELANAIFYIDEFMDISIALSELAVVMYDKINKPINELVDEALKGIVVDVNKWCLDVFIERTATDIHMFDKSIIGSCKQVLMFIK